MAKKQPAKNGNKNGTNKIKAADLPMLIKKSAVKELLHTKEMACAGEIMTSLNVEVHRMIKKAVIRAQDNRRQTVQSKDI